MLLRQDRGLLALDIALDIAFHAGRGGEVTGAAEIAERLGAARRGIEPLLQSLVRAGLLDSLRGPRGGYRMARAPREVPLTEIIAAVTEDEPGVEPPGKLATLVTAPLWQELEAAKQGIDPMYLFLDVVPYQFKAPEEDGLLGAFPGASLGLPHEGFASIANLRLIKVGLDAIKEPLAKFDEKVTRAALEKFAAQVKAQTGGVAVQGQSEAKQMLDAAMILLVDLKKVVESGKDVCVRRLTEAEAASEPSLSLVRQALSAPRIILAP
jgi:Rrf2 family protein